MGHTYGKGCFNNVTPQIVYKHGQTVGKARYSVVN